MKIFFFCLTWFCLLGASIAKQNLNLFGSKLQSLDNYTNNFTTVEQKESSYSHLLNFLKYMLLGPPKNSSQPDIFDVIQNTPDDLDLLTMIIGSTQNFDFFRAKNQFDENIFAG